MAENSFNRKRKRSKFQAHWEGLDEEGKKRFRQEVMDLAKHTAENPPTDEDRIDNAKSFLRDQIGVGEERPSGTVVLFFVEIGPASSQRGATCQHPTCKDRIKEGSYRIAVSPGMNNFYKSPDYYHVRCFEDLVDFSQAAYLDRVNPVTRSTAGLRGLKGTSVADGNYLVDGGAERLILKWKTSMGRLMDRRDGVEVKPLDPEFDDLLHKSGSASYNPKSIDGMSRHEFFNLSINLAPIESDGADDKEEWNLFEQHLPKEFEDVEDLKDPHSLSNMLGSWDCDKFLVHANEERLNDVGKEEKKKLSEKAVRAIKRLSSIPMPDFQSAFLGRLG